MMRWLFRIALIAAALWGGYWFIGAKGLEKAASTWGAERRAEDWQAEWSDATVRGFPNRFDLQLTDVQLADPGTGWVWTAPFFQVLSLSYKPNHLILVWPDTQSLQTPQQRLDITGEEMRGSVVLRPGTALALDRAAFVFRGVGVTSDQGWVLSMDEARLGTQTIDSTPHARAIGFEAKTLSPPLALMEALSEIADLPRSLEAVRLSAEVTFDADWDRAAIEHRRPQPRAIDLKLAEATWGQLQLKATGEMTVDEGGLPTGDLLIKATNWRDILAIGVATGAVPQELSGLIERALSLVSQLAGHPETLDIPISFRDGRIFAGPVALGPAPVLHLR
ncbi:DUF2125 domain-containing protein [Alphaproteobacteria bacterium KMM 3653]|uniref:DUF2125 domain-containing protein n=1 Tax=Harenicola maris TaxID=2841044 RepID=A0AAP2CMM4_9RHOB|nr:DUF2125 domain-containing protein [Harenicola maris]